MKGKATLFCIATAMLVAGAASAAQPLSAQAQARKATVEKIKTNQRNVVQPRTMAEANRTQTRLANGATIVAVPTDLWNQMSVERDASGAVRVREADGTSAPAATSEELPHE